MPRGKYLRQSVRFRFSEDVHVCFGLARFTVFLEIDTIYKHETAFGSVMGIDRSMLIQTIWEARRELLILDCELEELGPTLPKQKAS